MKKIYFLFACMTIMSIACGTQLPPVPSTEVKQPTSEVRQVSAAASHEPTESAPIYVTTAPLNVRACASVDCEKLADLPINTQVTVFILDLKGAGCEGGEWYAIDAPKSGYVCSLYIEER